MHVCMCFPNQLAGSVHVYVFSSPFTVGKTRAVTVVVAGGVVGVGRKHISMNESSGNDGS